MKTDNYPRRSERGQKPASNLYKLFVAGMPLKYQLEKMLSFFQQYGQFSLEVPLKTISKPESGLATQNIDSDQDNMKSQCVLVTRDSDLCEYMLQQKYFEFGGNNLTLLRHRTGVELMFQNKRLNRCRVIIKKVPKFFTEEVIKGVFESRFGQIDTIFKFKNDQAWNNQFGSIYDTYSVIFEHRYSADKAVNEASVQLDRAYSVRV